MRENPGNPRIISMSLIPYALVRPFLFSMDPEAAHDFTINAMASGQNSLLQCAWAHEQVSDPITLAG
jgi:dihydroorotate dehydrogenase